MAFEIYKPVHVVRHPRGKARMSTNRYVSFSAADFNLIGITTHAVVMIDREHRIIGLRKPSKEDPIDSIMKVKYNKTSTTGKVSLGGPMSVLNENFSKRTIDLIIRDEMIQMPFGCDGFPEVSKRKAK